MEQYFKDFLVAISPALQTLLQAVIIALVGMATAWVTKTYQLQKSKLSMSQQELLDMLVNNAVIAAEQVASTGEEKLAYAFDAVEKSLSQYGLKIDIDVIYSLIETKVFDNNDRGKFLK